MFYQKIEQKCENLHNGKSESPEENGALKNHSGSLYASLRRGLGSEATSLELRGKHLWSFRTLDLSRPVTPNHRAQSHQSRSVTPNDPSRAQSRRG